MFFECIFSGFEVKRREYKKLLLSWLQSGSQGLCELSPQVWDRQTRTDTQPDQRGQSVPLAPGFVCRESWILQLGDRAPRCFGQGPSGRFQPGLVLQGPWGLSAFSSFPPAPTVGTRVVCEELHGVPFTLYSHFHFIYNQNTLILF